MAHIGNKNALKHGQANTPTYYAWVDMRRRCNNSKHPAFKWYGARGIKFCERWSVFANFLADMGEKPSGMSLDRIDNDSNYTRSNCRWATDFQQQGNRRTSVLLSHDGKTQAAAAWARETGIPSSTIRYRIDHGWSAAEALTVRPQ